MIKAALAIAFEVMMASVQANPPVTIPATSARYRLTLEREAVTRFGLDAPVARITAQIHAESLWDTTAESPYAQGLGQFTPPTAQWLPSVCADLGPPDPRDANWSLRATTCYDA